MIKRGFLQCFRFVGSKQVFQRFSTLDDKEALLKSLQARRNTLVQENSSLLKENFTADKGGKEFLKENLTAKRDKIKLENAKLLENIANIKLDNEKLLQNIANQDFSKKIVSEPIRERIFTEPIVIARERTLKRAQIVYQTPQQHIYQQNTPLYQEPQIVYQTQPQIPTQVVYQTPPPPPQVVYQATVPMPPPPPPPTMPEINILEDDQSPWTAILIGGVVVLVATGCIYYAWKSYSHRKQMEKENLILLKQQNAAKEKELDEKNNAVIRKEQQSEKERELDEEIARLKKEIFEEEKKNDVLKQIMKKL